MIDAVIAATGLYTPPQSLSNAELVETFNTYVERFNASHAAEIETGEVQALIPSSAEFIEKASGIKSRFVVDKSGLIAPERPQHSRTLQQRNLSTGRNGGRGGP